MKDLIGQTGPVTQTVKRECRIFGETFAIYKGYVLKQEETLPCHG